MKAHNNLVMICIVLVLTAVSGASLAEGKLTGNVGVMSDYFYRGIDQQSGTTPSAGADYDLMDGVTLGVWIADVTDGIEYDLFGSFSGEIDEFNYSVGFTGYFYTGDFDDTYTELNLNGGYGPVSLEIAIGKHDLVTGGDEDYSFIAVTFEHEAYYGTVGTFGQDVDGNYLEVGYNKQFMELDTTLSLIRSNDDLSITGDSDISLVFTAVHDFDF